MTELSEQTLSICSEHFETDGSYPTNRCCVGCPIKSQCHAPYIERNRDRYIQNINEAAAEVSS